jgi:hypothetical protein
VALAGSGGGAGGTGSGGPTATIAGGIGVYSDITGGAVERAVGGQVGPVNGPSINGTNLTGGGGGGGFPLQVLALHPEEQAAQES